MTDSLPLTSINILNKQESALNYLLMGQAAILMAVILTLTLHAAINRKDTDRLP